MPFRKVFLFIPNNFCLKRVTLNRTQPGNTHCHLTGDLFLTPFRRRLFSLSKVWVVIPLYIMWYPLSGLSLDLSKGRWRNSWLSGFCPSSSRRKVTGRHRKVPQKRLKVYLLCKYITVESITPKLSLYTLFLYVRICEDL